MASHFQQYGGFTSLLYGLLTCVRDLVIILLASLPELISCQVLLLLGYQLLLHPLQRYPGPLLAKFTNVYSAFFAYKRTLHLEIWRYHQRYGPSTGYP